jgi:hypothetical protein
VTNENEEAKQECFDQHLLSVNGNNLKYNVRMGEKSIDLKVKLPQGITCTHCILQWRYRAGNNWVSSEKTRTHIEIGEIF